MRRLLTPLWLARHALALALVGAFLALGRWQLGRATGGNGLSWGYALQWPLFAVFVAAFWFRMARADLREHRGEEPSRPALPPLRPREPSPASSREPARTAPSAEAEDPELAAYNRYLAWLAANPDRRPNEYPG